MTELVLCCLSERNLPHAPARHRRAYILSRPRQPPDFQDRCRDRGGEEWRAGARGRRARRVPPLIWRGLCHKLGRRPLVLTRCGGGRNRPISDVVMQSRTTPFVARDSGISGGWVGGMQERFRSRLSVSFRSIRIPIRSVCVPFQCTLAAAEASFRDPTRPRAACPTTNSLVNTGPKHFRAPCRLAGWGRGLVV